MKKITIYCELIENDITNASLELISKAYDLKQKAKDEFGKDISIEGVVIASDIDNVIKQKIYSAGANRVVFIKQTSLNEFVSTVYSRAFVEYYSQNPSDVILFPASQKVRTLAPRITTTLDTGLVADCTELDLIEKNGEIKLAATRPTFGGELMATILSKKNPQCATVRAGTFKIKSVENVSDEYFVYNTIGYDETRQKLLRSLVETNSVSTLENVNIILAGGFGLVSNKNKTEYFEKLENLARKIDAKVGITRKIVDYGILDSSYQVGQTGCTVKPELYIAFGTSGAIQHVVGMKNSKTIIAINTDENAEIFKYADYKIVADAKKIIDDLLNKMI